jgi:hypothetical protein
MHADALALMIAMHGPRHGKSWTGPNSEAEPVYPATIDAAARGAVIGSA